MMPIKIISALLFSTRPVARHKRIPKVSEFLECFVLQVGAAEFENVQVPTYNIGKDSKLWVERLKAVAKEILSNIVEQSIPRKIET